MYVDDENSDAWQNKTTIALGMGLGQSDWSQKIFQKYIAINLPKIIDADALNLLAKSDQDFDLSNSIITPHEGEAARLLAISVAEVKKNRKATAKKLYEKYKAITVLKGKGTLIYDGKKMVKCSHGNAGMASAGMGDILSGIIAALLAQKLSPKNAAILGVNIHAIAGDMVAKNQGKIGMVATDLLQYLPKIINKLV